MNNKSMNKSNNGRNQNGEGYNDPDNMNRVFEIDTSGILKLMAALWTGDSLGGNICLTTRTFCEWYIGCHGFWNKSGQ